MVAVSDRVPTVGPALRAAWERGVGDCQCFNFSTNQCSTNTYSAPPRYPLRSSVCVRARARVGVCESREGEKGEVLSSECYWHLIELLGEASTSFSIHWIWKIILVFTCLCIFRKARRSVLRRKAGRDGDGVGKQGFDTPTALKEWGANKQGRERTTKAQSYLITANAFSCERERALM